LGYRKELYPFLVSETPDNLPTPTCGSIPRSSSDNIKTRAMSILNDVVAMELDSAGYEGPSTPLKDPTSSPAVHIQWQNSQSACAAMEELRVASSVPRRKFEFESFVDYPILNLILLKHQNLSRSISSSPHRLDHLHTPLILSFHHGRVSAPPDRAISIAFRAAPRMTSLPRPWRTRPSFSTCSAAHQRASTRTHGSV
jgi:hypothetical protein